MNEIVFVDLETLEKTEDIPTHFYCDSEIADVLINLNKKGYHTTYSCAGHNYSGHVNKDLVPLEEYDEWTKDFGNHPLLLGVEPYDDKSFLYMIKYTLTSIYIVFNQKYEFDSLPKGFKLEEDDDRIIIRKTIFYYNDENEEKWEDCKKQIEIDKEIEEARQDLLDWSLQLKPIKEKGMNL